MSDASSEAPTTLVVACSECSKRFRVSRTHVGRQGACPACRAEIRIGAEHAATPSAAAKRTPRDSKTPNKRLTEQRIRSSLTGPIKPVRPKLTYRLGVLLATFAMLLTPVVYAALIAATGYGVYYHAINHTEILTAARGRGAVLAALVYAAPLVVGPILVFFMMKPFFSRPRYDQRSRSLVRENEPLLFAFVDTICEAVRAPKPKRIDVDCQMNASASFRRGMLSFLGNDLVLTIGMPLVAGLLLRQFGGVLAHEFGHFSQGAGMRLTYVLRSVSAWLTRSVYERDNWDEWLINAAGSIDLRLGWVLYLAMLMVWLTRRVLWLLLQLSTAVAGLVLREMEYDADRYEARFGGSGCFESTSHKLARLGAATEMAYGQLGASQRDGKLVDDLPGLIRLNETRLSKPIVKAIDERIRTGRTGWFDTHPTDRDRIANAHREQADGVFSINLPAASLFSDFDAHCQAATWEFYRMALNRRVERESLRPVRSLDAEQTEQDDAFQALARFTQRTWRPSRPIGAEREWTEPAADAKKAAAAIRAARAAFDSSLEQHHNRLAKWDDLQAEIARARAYEVLHRASVRFKKGDVEEGFSDASVCVTTSKRAEIKAAKLGRKIDDLQLATTERLASALRLVANDAVAGRLSQGAKLRDQAAKLVPAMIAVEGQLQTIEALRLESVKLSALVNAIQGGGATEGLVDRVTLSVREIRPRLTQIRDSLAPHAYPFDHTKKSLTIGSHVVPAIPAVDELNEMLTALDETLDRVGMVQGRLAAGLCTIAEQVEAALKLPPLPDEPPAEATMG